MRIALDVRPLQNESAARGVGRYVRSLLSQLPRDGAEYLYLESRWGAPSASLPPEAPGRRLRLLRPPRAITLFDQVATPFLCEWKGIDVFHSTFYALPRLGSRRARLVLTVHDLIPIIVPGATGRKNTEIFRQIYRSALVADAVIVPSVRTATDLTERVGAPRGKVRVIPMGVGSPFRLAGNAPARPQNLSAGGGGGRPGVSRPGSRPSGSHRGGPESGSREERLETDVSRAIPAGAANAPGGYMRSLRAGGRRVLIYAGGFDANKNVPFLFDALEAMDMPEAVLCIAGDPGGSLPSLRSEAARRGLGNRVVFLGRLTDEDLASAYRDADVFVSASLYEGFGLPALEAMACGCPVVALTSGAVPEVLEGAAQGVEGSDPAAFARAVREVLEDDGRRRPEMITRGLARAAELTWERTARATFDLYREVIGETAR